MIIHRMKQVPQAVALCAGSAKLDKHALAASPTCRRAAEAAH